MYHCTFLPPPHRDDTELQKTFKVKMSKQKDLVTLTITGVTQKMSGVYQCVAKNSAGRATHEAKINVTGEGLKILVAIWRKFIKN